MSRTRTIGVVALLAVVVTATGVALAPRSGRPASGPTASSCVETYSTQTLTHRAFAFDGTITALGEPDDELGTVAADFRVAEWLRGGSAAMVRLDLAAPGVAGVDAEGGASEYAVGTRLLVSGEPRRGGRPLTDAVAWSCGFTRTHDVATAEAWRRSLTAANGRPAGA